MPEALAYYLRLSALANLREGILRCDLGNFLEGIFFLVFGSFREGILAIGMTWKSYTDPRWSNHDVPAIFEF